MTTAEPGASPRRRRPEPPRRPVLRAVLVVALAVVSFLLGIAFARTLDERPAPGETVTSIGTLPPIPEQTATVTVTVTQR